VIRLYRAPWSTNVQRVTMALAHKGLPYEEVVISYDDRSPVVAVSAQPLVPVLVVDGEVIADSMVIVARLEELVPDPPLFPADPAERALVEVFVEWFDRVWKVEPNAIEAGGPVDELAAVMDRRLDRFEALLAGRDFLFGSFSAADCCAYPFLKYAAGRELADDEPFHQILDRHQSIAGRPRLAAWIERVSRQAGDEEPSPSSAARRASPS
jgi:glutathione S-transferase